MKEIIIILFLFICLVHSYGIRRLFSYEKSICVFFVPRIALSVYKNTRWNFFLFSLFYSIVPSTPHLSTFFTITSVSRTIERISRTKFFSFGTTLDQSGALNCFPTQNLGSIVGSLWVFSPLYLCLFKKYKNVNQSLHGSEIQFSWLK